MQLLDGPVIRIMRTVLSRTQNRVSADRLGRV